MPDPKPAAPEQSGDFVDELTRQPEADFSIDRDQRKPSSPSVSPVKGKQAAFERAKTTFREIYGNENYTLAELNLIDDVLNLVSSGAEKLAQALREIRNTLDFPIDGMDKKDAGAIVTARMMADVELAEHNRLTGGK